MSKTIGSILQVASIAALGLVTAGAGLALAGGFTIGAGVGAAASLVGLPSAILVGGALAGLSYLFGPQAPRPAQTEQALKEPAPDRVSGYGRRRTFLSYEVAP